MSVWRGRLPLLWSVVLVGLLLGPALAPGYVLSYDLVWVPDLAWRPDFLGLSPGLPRAVPSDAVVSVLDEVVPGQLLEKLVLAGSLLAAGIGTARLVPAGAGATLGRLVAVTAVTWNPFVVERLVIGHWPLLVGYGALPWLVAVARRWRLEGAPPASLFLLVPLGSLSASAGLVTAAVVGAFALTADARRWLACGALVLAANAPWVVAGALHASSAVSDATAARVFGLSGEGSLPAPLAALSLGGILNSEVVPTTRTGFQPWVGLAVLVLLAALGLSTWWRHHGRRDAGAYLGLWLLGAGVPVLGWALPGVMAWAVSELPGVALLRDSSRLLALCAPLLALVVAEGARVVWHRVAGPAVLRALVAVVLVVLPVALMPDAGWGVSGRLRPADFPPSWAEAREVVATASGRADGDVLVLPLSSYRQPAWLDGRKVLDPLGRYLTPDYVASDELVVSATTLPGEDPRARAAGEALAAPTAGERAEQLAALGIGYVVEERDAGGDLPTVAGRVLLERDDLRVTALTGVRDRVAPRSWWVALIAAWSAFLLCPVVAVVRGLRAGRKVSDKDVRSPQHW